MALTLESKGLMIFAKTKCKKKKREKGEKRLVFKNRKDLEVPRKAEKSEAPTSEWYFAQAGGEISASERHVGEET